MGISFLPSRRVIAVDAGTRRIKVILVESISGKRRVLRMESMELSREESGSGEEIGRHLDPLLRELGDRPVAITLSQHLSISQVIELPQTGEGEVRRLIEEETIKLSGLSESAMAFDYARLKPFGRHRHPCWVTFCQEGEILALIERLALRDRDICEVTSTANALIASHRAVDREGAEAVLVDLGATSTVVALVHEGQGIYAGSFILGSDLFTERVAAETGSSLEQAETLKRTRNLLHGPDAVPGLASLVIEWLRELERILNESRTERAVDEEGGGECRVLLAGGGALQPGLIEYLNANSRLRFEPWPVPEGEERSGEFAAALGAALHGLGACEQGASLLPSSFREEWREKRSWSRLQYVNYALLAALVLIMGFGTWSKTSLLKAKQDLQHQAEAALERAELADILAGQIALGYERLRPVLQRRAGTLDTLEALWEVQRVLTNRNVFVILVADEQSYFSARTLNGTNATPSPDVSMPSPPLALKRGFIIELCVTDTGEAMRRTLTELVNDLKEVPLFRNVDTLPDASRRQLVDPQLVVSNRNFSLAVELAPAEFSESLLPRTSRAAPTAGRDGRPSFRSGTGSRPVNGRSSGQTDSSSSP